MPLKVDVADEDYTTLPSCLNYVRSALGVNPDCKFGPAQQVSSIDRGGPVEKSEREKCVFLYKTIAVESVTRV